MRELEEKIELRLMTFKPAPQLAEIRSAAQLKPYKSVHRPPSVSDEVFNAQIQALPSQFAPSVMSKNEDDSDGVSSKQHTAAFKPYEQAQSKFNKNIEDLDSLMADFNKKAESTPLV